MASVLHPGTSLANAGPLTGGPVQGGAQSAESRNSQILQFLPLVRQAAAIVARRLPPSVELDDLVQAGTLGLIDAVRRHDPARHPHREQYIRIRITGAIFDSLREQDWASRYMRTRQQRLRDAEQRVAMQTGRAATSDEVADELGMDLESYFEFAAAVQELKRIEPPADEEEVSPVLETVAVAPQRDEPDAVYARKEFIDRIQVALARMPRQERTVLFQYYVEEQTLREIAEALRKTESRISQIRAQAVRRLSVMLRGK